MTNLHKVALLTTLLTVLTGGALAGCTGTFTANATPSPFPATQSSTSNASEAPQDAGDAEAFNRGPIQFQPGQTSTSVSNYLTLNQIDRYTFQASAGQPTTININAPNQNVLLTIINPDGNPIVAPQDGISNWSGVLSESGTYTIEAVDAGGPAWYNLSLSIQPSNANPGPNPGPQVYNHGPIQFQPGATLAVVSGDLTYQSTDRYTFHASAGQPASINIISPYRKVRLTLTAPDGEVLQSYLSGASLWRGTLPESGTYTIDAVDVTGPSYYNLQLNIQPANQG